MGAQEHPAVLGVTRWRWMACGKHPSASDFFKIGARFLLAESLAEWIDRGYRALPEGSRRCRRSWRFWATGGPRELAIGLLVDSRDSLGRPYPLLLMGSGPLPGWEEHWELLTILCQKAWIGFECVACERFSDLNGMQAALEEVTPPAPVESSVLTSTGNLYGKPPPVSSGGEDKDVIDVDIAESYDNLSSIVNSVSCAGLALNKVPTAVFIAGEHQIRRLLLFQRPLSHKDFFLLWLNER